MNPEMAQYLNCRWLTIEGARRAGRRDARLGKPPRSGVVAWPGNYMDAYREAQTRGGK